jgi:tetratricopeptide (TPR) repeat protein
VLAPAQLFYSYSHKDEKLLDRLAVHLSALKREGLISEWHDRKIGAGHEWKGAIDDHLKAAEIILLLVSADFLASDYCFDIELGYAMERHNKGEARVIPVILQPCDWHTSSFAKLQALPKEGKPITKWSNRNDAFVNIAAGIRNALKEMRSGYSPAAATNSSAPAPSVSTPQQISPAAPALNALHQLPTPPADFTGRKDELKELLEAVNTGGIPISGLQGLGGVGKTALALKLAEQLKPDYPDAQFYLDLKGVSPQPLTPRDAMAYVVRAYNPTAQLPEKDEELAAIYRSVLNGKCALLLMDNARDAQQISTLIPPASCFLLVTSRKHFTLPGLFKKNLDKLPVVDARDLLLRIAPRLKKETTAQLDELTDLCGCLPLALRAVGSALEVKKNITVADYAARLKETGKNLVLKEIDPSLQKSIGAALQSSYELLSNDLQHKFRFLSVFPDTFNLAATAAIWEIAPEDAENSLSDLIAYSLVEFIEISQRYELHDLVRLFAYQILSSDEQNIVRTRHAEYYLGALEIAEALYRRGGVGITQGLALFDVEWTNVETGHNWVVAHQNDNRVVTEWCSRYPNSAANCLDLRLHAHERILWLELALRSARHLKQRLWEGITSGNLGCAYRSLGDYRRATEYHEQHLKIARETDDRQGEANALGNLGITSDCLGEYVRAIEFYKENLQIVREIGDRLGQGNSMGNLGSTFLALEDYRSSIVYCEQQLQIARDIGDRRGEANAVGTLGVAYLALGEYERAIAYLELQLQIAGNVGDRMCAENALGNLGTAYYRLGEQHRAIEYYEQSMQIAREIGDRLGEACALFNSALALHQLDKRSQAIFHAEAALKVYEAIESPNAARTLATLAKWRLEDITTGKNDSE